MDSVPPLLISLPVCWALGIVALGALACVGWVLVPRTLFTGTRLATLTVRIASGLAFVTSVSATLACGRWMFLTVIPVLQIAAVIVSRRRPQRVEAGAVEDTWTRRNAWVAAGIVLAATWLFLSSHDYRLPGGRVQPCHSDIGFYTGLVDALPEASAANSWAVLLGEHAVAASGVRDQWYHWGAMYFASAIRALTGVSAIQALLDVTALVMNVLLILASAAIGERLCRGLSVTVRIAMASAALLGTPWLEHGWIVQFVSRLAADQAGVQSRFALAVAFAYQYEGAIALSALAAWLGGGRLMAGLLLVTAAMGAPHVVAAVGCTAGLLMAVGLVLRRRDIWQPAAVITGLLLLAWVLVVAGGARFPKNESQSVVDTSLWSIAPALLAGCARNIALTLLLSLPLLPGLWHLARSEERGPRFIGLLAWSGLLAPCFALMLLHHQPDRFHVMVMTQALIVMPAGLWGLARMARHGSSTVSKATATGLIVACVGMGVHGLLQVRHSEHIATWTIRDAAAIQRGLRGRPFGYLTAQDRAWWLSKHGFLAGLLGSRGVRVNPETHAGEHAQYYGGSAPFKLVPMKPGESVADWCHRFIAALGIRHLLATDAEPLPSALAQRCKLLVHTGGLALYELPDDIAAGMPLNKVAR